MLDWDGRYATSSPIYVRDRRIPALQAEPNAPLTGFSPLVEDCAESSVDMTSMIEATREAAERRRKLQSTQLRRFHQQICVRVNERVLQQREKQQTQAKKVDEKLARLLQSPASSPVCEDPAAALRRQPPALTRGLTREPFVETLLQRKKHQCQGADAVFTLVKNAVRSESAARELLLASTRVARVRVARGCEQTTVETGSDNQAEEEAGDAVSSHGRVHVELPVKQRLELYTAVRRRYMALERERVQQRHRSGNQKSLTGIKAPLQPSKPPPSKANVRWSKPEIAVIDASVGGEMKLQRQSSKASSTPWRKSPLAPSSAQSSARNSASGMPGTSPPSTSGGKRGAMQKERFLSALQEQLGTPALCSCGRRSQQTECANNCAFYRQPKKKERFAASVCQQHQAACT